METPNRGAVLSRLRTRALFVTAVDRESARGARLKRSLRFGIVSQRALLTFFRSFSTLLRAGVSIRNSLTVAIDRCSDAALREALRSILADVEDGCALSDAMAKRPAAFPPLQVAMIRAGEAGGILDDVLERLARFLERDADLRKKVGSALAYPAVVLMAALALVIFLIAWIVPMFSTMFAGFHAELPWTTAALLFLGRSMQRPTPWLVFAAVIFVIGIGAERCSRTTTGAIALDRVRLRVPIVGSLLHKSITARISRMLATLLRSGIELVTAIEVVAPVTGSVLYQQAFGRVITSLREGEAFTVPLAGTQLFDPLFIALVHVGEETGLMDEMLLKVAEYFESDVESTIATLGAIIEPALIVFLGSVVGFIVFSIFVPLYSLIGSVSK